MAFSLFIGFAVVTKVQFDRIAQDKINAARLESYDNAVKVYEAELAAYQTCFDSIAVRDTYRALFDGVERMFLNTAELPVELFPEDPVALAYREQMIFDIRNLITIPIENGLPPKTLDDCPSLPITEPERPEL